MLVSAISNPYRVVKNSIQSGALKGETKHRQKSNDRSKGRWLTNKSSLVYLVMAILFIIYLELMRYVFILSFETNSNQHEHTSHSYTSSNEKSTTSMVHESNGSIDIQSETEFTTKDRESNKYDKTLSKDMKVDNAVDDLIGNTINKEVSLLSNNEVQIQIKQISHETFEANRKKTLREELYESSLKKVVLARQLFLEKQAETKNTSLVKEPFSFGTETRAGTCDKDDAFQSIPLDMWVPPDDSSTEKKEQWKRAFNNAMARIRSSKLGGDNLRRFVRDQTEDLQSLRHSLFCRKPAVRGTF